jgi:hypothetical protein
MEDCVQKLGECSTALMEFQRLDDRDSTARVLHNFFNPMIGPEAHPSGGFQSEVGRVSEQIQQDDEYHQGEGAVLP